MSSLPWSAGASGEAYLRGLLPPVENPTVSETAASAIAESLAIATPQVTVGNSRVTRQLNQRPVKWTKKPSGSNPRGAFSLALLPCVG